MTGGGIRIMVLGSFLAPENYSPLQTVPTQIGARTMALDPKTHRVFLVTATAAPAAPGTKTRRRSSVPGTFTLLVYGLVNGPKL